jgi:hypothetical protein
MRLPFSRRRTAELETKNRILTDAARKRAEGLKNSNIKWPNSSIKWPN